MESKVLDKLETYSINRCCFIKFIKTDIPNFSSCIILSIGCYAHCYDYVGNEDSTLNTACDANKRYNYKNCQHLCKLNRTCEHFSFNKITSCCYLKAGKVSLIRQDVNVVSGPKFCPHARQRGILKLRKGFLRQLLM